MNVSKQEPTRKERDPLGLGRLPMVEPPADGWTEIRAALQADRRRRRTRVFGAWAVAASLVAAVVLAVIAIPRQQAGPGVAAVSEAGPAAEVATGPVPVADLIALSQVLELRLRRLRDQTGSIPGEAALYIAELEDTVARVDGALSAQPDSAALWSRRVNLMLDLELIYQHHWEREYGRMAAL